VIKKIKIVSPSDIPLDDPEGILLKTHRSSITPDKEEHEAGDISRILLQVVLILLLMDPSFTAVSSLSLSWQL